MLLLGVLLSVTPAFCTIQCPKNCAAVARRTDPTCDHSSGTCLEGCRPGFYGATCALHCDINCLYASCHQLEGTCPCKLGYRLKNGVCHVSEGQECTSDSQHCTDNICISGGREECLYGCTEGWFGEFCDRNCTTTCFCDQESGVCTVCIAGWFGMLCDRRCAKSCICDQESGACTGCVAGWFGAECESPCSSECLGGNCLRNGSCIQGCKLGSYGAQCERKCSQYCMTGCDSVTGNCKGGCITGTFGDKCDIECSKHCVSGCVQTTGNCKGGCTSGTYGEQCDLKCPQHCVTGCDPTAGNCNPGGCTIGTYGDRCDLKCSQHCVNGCDHMGNCTKCEAGWYGSSCQFQCSPGCVRANSICDRDGKCKRGCVEGNYGEKCESICPQQCHTGCSRINGSCSACNKGFFGVFCRQPCRRCIDDACNQNTGECNKECNGTTDKCVRGCERGFYGPFCNITCENCKHGDCDTDTGECKLKDDTRDTRGWVGGGMAVIIVIILMAAGLAYFVRRKQRMHDAICNVANLRRQPPSGQYLTPVVAPEYVDLDRVCPVIPMRVNNGTRTPPANNTQIQPTLQLAVLLNQEEDVQHGAVDSTGNCSPSELHNISPGEDVWSDAWSDDWSADRFNSYMDPRYSEVNEDLMATHPQPAH